MGRKADAGSRYITFVNVLSVDPEMTEAVCAMLRTMTEDVLRRHRGLLGAQVHRSLDGTRVMNVTQWRSPDDLDGVLADPAVRERMRHLLTVASSDPEVYESVWAWPSGQVPS